MSEDRDQRTEEATPRKQEKLREEGQVIKSQDVVAAAVGAASCMVIGRCFDSMGRGVATLAQRSFRLLDAHEPLRALKGQLDGLAPLGIILGSAALAAFISGFAQSRMFSFSLLMPKPERLEPMRSW